MESTRCFMDLLNTTNSWKLMQVQMIFFIRQAPSLRRGWSATAVRAWDDPGGDSSFYCVGKQDLESHLGQGRRFHLHEWQWRRNKDMKVHVSLACCMYGRERQCVDSEEPRSTGHMVEMAGIFDGFGWLLPPSNVHAQEWRALHTGKTRRRVQCSHSDL